MTLVEYELGFPAVLAGSERYMVVPLIHTRGGARERETTGAVAIDLGTGKATLFKNPNLDDTSPSKQCWECDLVPLCGGCCGVVFRHRNDGGEVSANLFAWDLANGAISCRGRWPVGLVGLFHAIDSSRFKVTPDQDKGGKWTGRFDVCQLISRTKRFRYRSIRGYVSLLRREVFSIRAFGSYLGTALRVLLFAGLPSMIIGRQVLVVSGPAQVRRSGGGFPVAWRKRRPAWNRTPLAPCENPALCVSGCCLRTKAGTPGAAS